MQSRFGLLNLVKSNCKKKKKTENVRRSVPNFILSHLVYTKYQKHSGKLLLLTWSQYLNGHPGRSPRFVSIAFRLCFHLPRSDHLLHLCACPLNTLNQLSEDPLTVLLCSLSVPLLMV